MLVSPSDLYELHADRLALTDTTTPNLRHLTESSVGLFLIFKHNMRRFQSPVEQVVVLIQGKSMLDEHYAVCRAIQAYVTR